MTDAGLKHLVGLTQLKWLNLQSTAVTDDGLKHLTGLTKLRYLILDSTAVTDPGKEERRKHLPNV